jgi:hypothetical protein
MTKIVVLMSMKETKKNSNDCELADDALEYCTNEIQC